MPCKCCAMQDDAAEERKPVFRLQNVFEKNSGSTFVVI
jgi:hypothetical protein